MPGIFEAFRRAARRRGRRGRRGSRSSIRNVISRRRRGRAPRPRLPFRRAVGRVVRVRQRHIRRALRRSRLFRF